MEQSGLDKLKDLLDAIAENARQQDEINALNMQGFKLLDEKIMLLKELVENLHTAEEMKKANMMPTRTPVTPVMPTGLKLL